MTILYPVPAPVKSARPFAAGILPPIRPGRAFEPSAADRAWWAAESDRMESARLNSHYDDLAAESAAIDALTLGLIPADA